MENQVSIKEGKTTAIISYLTWIGTIIAFVMNNGKKNHFASFHIRQMIGLCIFSIINSFLIVSFSKTASYIIGIILFVLWLIGFIGAINGNYKKVPLLGEQFQEWFKRL